MSNFSDKEVGSEAWWEATREDIKDISRSYPRKDDGRDVKKARAYLGARHSRLAIEKETQDDKLTALPYRLAELFKARRLASLLDVEFDTRGQRDELLPTLARMTIDQPEQNT